VALVARLRTLWPIVVIGLVAAIGFAALGVWQVERLAWKNALVAAIETRSTATPIDLARSDWADAGLMQPYQRVAVSGTYMDHNVLAQAVTARGGGFWVMTPLLLNDGRAILVNRGFVGQGRAAATVGGQRADVTGLLRETEAGGGFLRANDADAGRWYSRDVEAISSTLNLATVAPFFIDADDVAGDDVEGGLTVLTFSNNHLVYALTWFALAAMVLGALAFLLRERRSDEAR